MDRTHLEPLALFRSFLTVVSGFVFAQVIYFAIALLLGYLFFPEFLVFFELDDAEQKKMIAENIQAAIPLPMFLAHLALSLLAFWFVGWLAAAVAPFAHFQHGLFIAILIFAWFLQSFVEDPPSKKLMNFFLMVTLPIPVLLGARRSSEVIVEADHE